jgi:hypothetical protein
MLKHQLSLGASVALLLLLLALSAGSSVAQQASPTPAAQPDIQCGGQYECLEDRPLTPAEAQASRSHPLNAQPQEVAATPATVSEALADERVEANSSR